MSAADFVFGCTFGNKAIVISRILIPLRLYLAILRLRVATLCINPRLLAAIILRITSLHRVQVDVLRNCQLLGTFVYEESFLARCRDAAVRAE